MPRLVSVARGKAVIVTSLALLAGALAAGCDTQEEADLDRGRTSSPRAAATCHALAEARASATHRAQPRLRLRPGPRRRHGPGHDRGRRRGPDRAPPPRRRGGRGLRPDLHARRHLHGLRRQGRRRVRGERRRGRGDRAAARWATARTSSPRAAAAATRSRPPGPRAASDPTWTSALADQDAELTRARRSATPRPRSPRTSRPASCPSFDCDVIPQENLKDLINFLLESVDSKETADKLPDECAA